MEEAPADRRREQLRGHRGERGELRIIQPLMQRGTGAPQTAPSERNLSALGGSLTLGQNGSPEFPDVTGSGKLVDHS